MGEKAIAQPVPPAEKTAPRSSAGALPQTVRPYDFRRPRHLSGEQMRNIHRAHAACAAVIAARLSRYLGANLEVRLESSEEVAYGLFMDGLAEHTYTNLLDLSPLHEKGLLLIDAALCLAFLDRALGGECRVPAKPRPLTAIDQAGAEASIEIILRCLREAWKDIYPLKLTVVERRTSPQQVQVAPRPDPVLAITFLVGGDAGQGRFCLCLPIGGLKAATETAAQKALLAKATPEKSAAMRAALMRSLERAPLRLNALVGRTELSLGHLARLKTGDIIRLDQPADGAVLVKVGERPAFFGRMGLRGRKKAVQITARIDANEEE